jgi:tetratricopeptide (TPR) repeat protein
MRFSGDSSRWATVLLGGALLCASAASAQNAAVQNAAVRNATAQNATVDQINSALQQGEADNALALVSSLPQAGVNDAEAQNLACRVRFTLQQWSQAAGECQQAVNLEGNNSNYHLWLGRTLGEWAARATFLNAYSLGKRVRAEFEAAVRLDPRNPAALSDLGSFYNEAPGLMGGGADKAEGVAAQLDKVEPARAHQLRGEIAEQRKDYDGAEREFKLAIAASAHPAQQWTVLAAFYQRRQNWAALDAAIHSCVTAAAHDPGAGVALYDGAGVLIRTRRDPQLAAKMLEDYLGGNSKTDEAPAFVAHWRLSRLQQLMGDSAGATREQAAAYNLAREYKPPQEH